jgi:DNA-binding transcriptional LysR family regulator
MNLNTLDLNLVPALRALLEERNVTRAGQRVGLSQPAMSAALARLRRHFGDELLSRASGQYELTVLGRALLHRTATACDLIERVFASQVNFDPARQEHEFIVHTSDYAVAVFGTRLASEVHARAPGVRLRFRQTPADLSLGGGGELLSTSDGLFMPHGIISGYPAIDLFTDRWVCLVAVGNEAVGDRLTMDHLATLPWVSYQRAADALAARQLSMIGVEPRVEVAVDNFALLPFLVAGTRRIALIQESLAARLRGVAAVRVMRPPYDPVPLREAMWWHPVHTHDAAHTWLRETVAKVAASTTLRSE